MMFTRLQYRIIVPVLVMAVVGAVALAIALSDRGAPCFDGVLSEDPLHCYVLEEAHREGVITVDAMYSGYEGLSVFLEQTEPLGDDFYAYVELKVREEVRRSGGDECVLSQYHCENGVLPDGRPGSYGYLLPRPVGHKNILLRTGGTDASTFQSVWAIYQQVWPARGEGSLRPADFDVSEVDVSNFPAMECSGRYFPSGYCDWWNQFPRLGIAGFEGSTDHGWLQVKTSPGEEEVTFAAAKQAVIQRYPRRFNEENLTIIPVKYSLEDLWRWQLVLDRFAQSPGNTLGVDWASIGRNHALWPSAVLTEAGGLREASRDYPEYRETIRTTIILRTLLVDETLEALPRLLRQLGIPEDAVGIVEGYPWAPTPTAWPHGNR